MLVLASLTLCYETCSSARGIRSAWPVLGRLPDGHAVGAVLPQMSALSVIEQAAELPADGGVWEPAYCAGDQSRAGCTKP